MSAINFATIDLTKTPLAPPPPGVIPNFVNPPTIYHIPNTVQSIMLPLMLAFVSLRVYSNLCISHNFALSDYVCVLATLSSISYSALLYVTITQDILGLHMWDVPVSRQSDSSVQNLMVLTILYGPMIFLAKLAVLLLYLELFRVHKRARITVFIGVVIISAQCLATIIGYSVLRVPMPGVSWLIHSSTYKCGVTAALFGVIMGAISVFSDLYVILIPLPVIWQLNMPTRRKVAVSIVFITGLFALAASIIALVYRIRQHHGQDNTWNGVYTYLLFVVEANVSIMCSCMPSYVSCLRHHLPALRTISYRLRSKFYSPYKQRSSTSKLNEVESVGSDPKEDRMMLTLGSAV